MMRLIATSLALGTIVVAIVWVVADGPKPYSAEPFTKHSVDNPQSGPAPAYAEGDCGLFTSGGWPQKYVSMAACAQEAARYARADLFECRAMTQDGRIIFAIEYVRGQPASIEDFKAEQGAVPNRIRQRTTAKPE